MFVCYWGLFCGVNDKYLTLRLAFFHLNQSFFFLSKVRKILLNMKECSKKLADFTNWSVDNQSCYIPANTRLWHGERLNTCLNISSTVLLNTSLPLRVPSSISFSDIFTHCCLIFHRKVKFWTSAHAGKPWLKAGVTQLGCHAVKQNLKAVNY